MPGKRHPAYESGQHQRGSRPLAANRAGHPGKLQPLRRFYYHAWNRHHGLYSRSPVLFGAAVPQTHCDHRLPKVHLHGGYRRPPQPVPELSIRLRPGVTGGQPGVRRKGDSGHPRPKRAHQKLERLLQRGLSGNCGDPGRPDHPLPYIRYSGRRTRLLHHPGRPRPAAHPDPRHGGPGLGAAERQLSGRHSPVLRRGRSARRRQGRAGPRVEGLAGRWQDCGDDDAGVL